MCGAQHRLTTQAPDPNPTCLLASRPRDDPATKSTTLTSRHIPSHLLPIFHLSPPLPLPLPPKLLRPRIIAPRAPHLLHKLPLAHSQITMQPHPQPRAQHPPTLPIVHHRPVLPHAPTPIPQRERMHAVVTHACEAVCPDSRFHGGEEAVGGVVVVDSEVEGFPCGGWAGE